MKTIRLLLCVFFAVGFSIASYASWAYKDNDGDGYAGKMKEITPAQEANLIAKGWLISPTKPMADCNDADNTVWEKVKLFYDNDGDKRTVSYIVTCVGATLPPKYIREADVLGYTDCDDTDPAVFRNTRLCRDEDDDNWASDQGVVGCYGDVAPVGYTFINDVLGFADCDDHDPSVWQTVGLLFDNDGDFHVVIGTPLTMYCVGNTAPPKYIFPVDRKGITDCNDNDATVWRNVCARPIAGPPGRPNETFCIGTTWPPGYMECIPGPEAEIITFSVYPNPATDRVYMMPEKDLKNRVEVKLMDAYGRVIRMVSAPNAIKGQSLSINTGDLKPGLYRIAIQSGETIVSKTIAVKL